MSSVIDLTTAVVAVYAVDRMSDDPVSYIVECKNWSSEIDRSVIQAFTGIKREIGADVGIFISEHRLPAGLEKYIHGTNIHIHSYESFQLRYLVPWFDEHFLTTIWLAASQLVRYTEPVNSQRDKIARSLPIASRRRVKTLRTEYELLAHFLQMWSKAFQGSAAPYLGGADVLEDFRKTAGDFERIARHRSLKASSYRELLSEWSSPDFPDGSVRVVKAGLIVGRAEIAQQ